MTVTPEAASGSTTSTSGNLTGIVTDIDWDSEVDQLFNDLGNEPEPDDLEAELEAILFDM